MLEKKILIRKEHFGSQNLLSNRKALSDRKSLNDIRNFARSSLEINRLNNDIFTQDEDI